MAIEDIEGEFVNVEAAFNTALKADNWPAYVFNASGLFLREEVQLICLLAMTAKLHEYCTRNSKKTSLTLCDFR